MEGREWLSAGICVIVGALVLIGAIGVVRDPARYQTFAQQQGWTVQPHPHDHLDYLFQGHQDGLSWQMECYWFGSRVLQTYRRTVAVVVWRTAAAVLSNDVVLIYPRQPGLQSFLPPRRQPQDAWEQATQAATRNHTDTRLAALAKQRLGMPEFDQRFEVRASARELAVLVQSVAERSLLNWPAPLRKLGRGPVIVADETGLTMWWLASSLELDWLVPTVQLGLTMAKAIRERAR